MPRSTPKKRQRDGYLDGSLLVAMPAMGDPRFARAVIYMCAHSADGAMGIIINHRAPNISFTELLEQLNSVPPKERIRLPMGLGAMAVHLGGPVETGRGFVLHSADYFKATQPDVPTLRRLLNQYQVAWTILAPSDPTVAAMDAEPGWKRLYADSTAVIHQRITPATPAG